MHVGRYTSSMENSTKTAKPFQRLVNKTVSTWRDAYARGRYQPDAEIVAFPILWLVWQPQAKSLFRNETCLVDDRCATAQVDQVYA
jgi:hypothetical protein